MGWLIVLLFQKVPGQTQTFNDGRVVLDGFILSDKPVAEDKW